MGELGYRQGYRQNFALVEKQPVQISIFVRSYGRLWHRMLGLAFLTETPTKIGNYATIRAFLRHSLLPLDRSRRLAGIVIHHSVNSLDLVDDPRSDAAEEGAFEGINVGSHTIGRSYSA
jgi:hypothetical protein